MSAKKLEKKRPTEVNYSFFLISFDKFKAVFIPQLLICNIHIDHKAPSVNTSRQSFSTALLPRVC